MNNEESRQHSDSNRIDNIVNISKNLKFCMQLYNNGVDGFIERGVRDTIE